MSTEKPAKYFAISNYKTCEVDWELNPAYVRFLECRVAELEKNLKEVKMPENISEFEKHTKRTQDRYGLWTIECRKGLWSVSAMNKNRATQEAFNYFMQYWSDGEYE